MALEVGTLFARLKLEDGQFTKGLQKSKEAFTKMGNTVSSKSSEMSKNTKNAFGNMSNHSHKAASGLKNVDHSAHGASHGIMAMYKSTMQMTVVMGMVTATLAPFVAAFNGIKYNASLEQSAIAFETLLGSAENSAKMIKDLQEFGASTPFEFEGLQKATQTMLGLGISSEKIMPTLEAVGNAVSAVGGSQDDLQGIALAIGQMNTKGKISAEEMNQLAERGIGAWDILAQKMGKTPQEIMKMGEEGKLFAKDVLPLLTEGLNEKFGGAIEKQSKTFNGLLSTLTDKFKILTGEITKGAFERLKSVLPPIISFVEQLTEGFKEGGLLGALKNVLPQEVFDKFTMFSEVVLTVFEGVKTFIMGWVEYIKALFTGEGNVGQSFIDMFNTAKTIVMPILSDMVSFIKEKFQQIKQFWDENGAQIIQAVKNFWNVVSIIFKAIAPVILLILKSLWGNVKGVIDGALKIIMGLIKIFTGIFTLDFKKMWEGIKQLFSGAVQFVWNLINLMFVGKILGGIKTFAKTMVSRIKDLVLNIGKAFKGLVDQSYSWGKDLLMGLIRGIKDWATYAIKKVVGAAKDIAGAIKGFFGINSPSKLMTEYGGYIGEGLEVGMGKKLSSLARMAGKMSKAALPDLTPNITASGLSGAGASGSITIQMTGNNYFNDRSDIDYLTESLSTRIRDKMYVRGVR